MTHHHGYPILPPLVNHGRPAATVFPAPFSNNDHMEGTEVQEVLGCHPRMWDIL